MFNDTKLLIKRFLPFVVPITHAIRHKASLRKIRHLLKQRKSIALEIGAGEKKGKGEWLTLDANNVCDLCWDLRRGIPFPDNSLTKIYSSHLFEHLSIKDIQRTLDECIRALAPGGSFSICVPNARLYIEAYVRNDVLDESKFFGYKPAYNQTTRIDYVNYTAYMDNEHKYMFDEDNLLYLLRSRGFRNARLRPFDPGLDKAERDFESIYAEAEK